MASKPTTTKGKAAPPPPAKKPAPAAPQRQAAPAAPPQAEAAEQAKGTEVAVRRGSAMSTDFAQAMGEHATGAGLSQAQEDNLVPLAYILQKLSPQCEPKKAEHIEGAKPGQIWLKQSGLVDADMSENSEGQIVQPCHFSKWIMEWIPRDSGGGLVGRYEMMIGETAEQALKRHGREFDKTTDPKNPKRQKLVTPEGHELIEVREHVCRVFVDNDPTRAIPYVFPMSGTNHTVSRGWMLMMNSKNVNGQRLNSYTSLYRLRTKWNQNEQGDWYNYDVQDCGTLDQGHEVMEGFDWQHALQQGKALADAFSSGEKKANVEDYADDSQMQGDVSGTAGGGGDGSQADDGVDPI
jgi:hypothetical protein